MDCRACAAWLTACSESRRAVRIDCWAVTSRSLRLAASLYVCFARTSSACVSRTTSLTCSRSASMWGAVRDCPQYGQVGLPSRSSSRARRFCSWSNNVRSRVASSWVCSAYAAVVVMPCATRSTGTECAIWVSVACASDVCAWASRHWVWASTYCRNQGIAVAKSASSFTTVFSCVIRSSRSGAYVLSWSSSPAICSRSCSMS